MKNDPEKGEPAPARPLLEILVALAEGDASAAEVLDTLEGWPGGRALPLGSFYRHLERGVRQEWIAIVERSPGRERGQGRPSRRYRLTETGRQAATAAVGRIERLTALARTAGFVREEVP